MSNGRTIMSNRLGFYALALSVTAAALATLFTATWIVPPTSYSKYWNGLVAFALLGIACDSSFLPISRITFAKVSSSVAFIPFLASVALFDPPWPMAISGLTAVIVEAFVRRKPLSRIWFNTAQYMLAAGLASAVYRGLGGQVGIETFSFSVTPFFAAVIAFFFVNLGSVSLAVAAAGGMSFRESWAKVVGGSLLYDFFSSSLALLLAFLYVKFEFIGLGVLIVALFFVRHVYQMNFRVEQVNRELLELMVKAIEARDPYTSGHSVRVAEYARSMARELGLSTKQVDYIATAALLHDVGKIYEDFALILRKEGRLTPEERMTMQTHPVRSADLVGTIAALRGGVQAAIRHHHENFDGTGYPDGLSGEQIPIGARIIMIADTIDAMTTDRPYRVAMSLERAIEELERYSGHQFDPRLVQLVSKSPTIRRLLGAEARGPEPTSSPSRPVKATWVQRVAR